MHPAERFPRLRRGASLLALTGLLGFTAVSLSNCRAVEDNLTGVRASIARGGPGSCISTCAKAYADSNRAESEVHVPNIQACGGEPVCEALEYARHEAAVARISAGRERCFNDCRYQGGGTGGQ
jgi:hypothetical protein